MAQESPSRLLYAQAVQVIKQLQQSYATSQKSPDEVSTILNGVLTKFAEQAGYALTTYEPVIRSEVPLSAKMNRFWSSLQDDINILQDQVDILNASAIFMHNYIKMEILKGQSENAQLQNKLKTLQLYSNVDNDSLLYFGDSFITEDFIDWDLVPNYDRATVDGAGFITLRIQMGLIILKGLKQRKMHKK